MHDETRVTILGREPHRHHGIVNPPVYHASTILYPTLDALEAPRTADGYYYGRYGTPTTRALAEALAALDGADARLVVQAVGPRLSAYFDRPWAGGEERTSSLVVIGEKGLRQDAIAAALAG